MQAFDPLPRNQRIAVDTHKTVAKFILECLERLVEQHFARFMAQGHVLVIGDEVDDLSDRDQLDALAGSGTDVAAGTTALVAWTSERGQLAAVWPVGLAQSLTKRLPVHRLGHIAEGGFLEGIFPVLVITGTEHERRRRLTLAQSGSDLQTIEARHADIQQDNVGFQAFDQRKGLFTIGGTWLQHGITLEFTEHSA